MGSAATTGSVLAVTAAELFEAAAEKALAANTERPRAVFAQRVKVLEFVVISILPT